MRRNRGPLNEALHSLFSWSTSGEPNPSRIVIPRSRLPGHRQTLILRLLGRRRRGICCSENKKLQIDSILEIRVRGIFLRDLAVSGSVAQRRFNLRDPRRRLLGRRFALGVHFRWRFR